jgi:mono/diheme cytochrome c family protein
MGPARRPSKRYRVNRPAAAGGTGLVVALALTVLQALTAAAPVRGEEGAAAAADEELTNPFLGQQEAIDAGERIFRARCVGCHWSPLRGPKLFQSKLSDQRFLETVINGRKGARGTMPTFGYVLSPDDVWKVHAFVMSRDRL